MVLELINFFYGEMQVIHSKIKLHTHIHTEIKKMKIRQ